MFCGIFLAYDVNTRMANLTGASILLNKTQELSFLVTPVTLVPQPANILISIAPRKLLNW